MPDHALQKFSSLPPPLVIEPGVWGARQLEAGDAWSFDCVLIGQAIARLPLVVEVWRHALARGLGRLSSTAILESVGSADGTDVLWYDPRRGWLAQPETLVGVPPLEGYGAVSLAFVTPLRLKREGHLLTPNTLKPRDVLVATLRRIGLLAEFHGGQRLPLDYRQLAQRAETIEAEGALAWRDWSRYSNRQGESMQLGGVVGAWRLRGDLTPFLPFLYLAQWTHIGKGTVFGLGQVRLTLAP